jgi:hypothetical protein
VHHIQHLTAIIFCPLAPSLLHSANAGHAAAEPEASCSVAACGCTGCHSVHEEARSTQKGSLCRGQHACARTFRRIFTQTSTLPSLTSPPGCGETPIRVARINPNWGLKKGSKTASFCYATLRVTWRLCVEPKNTSVKAPEPLHASTVRGPPCGKGGAVAAAGAPPCSNKGAMRCVASLSIGANSRSLPCRWDVTVIGHTLDASKIVCRRDTSF